MRASSRASAKPGTDGSRADAERSRAAPRASAAAWGALLDRSRPLTSLQVERFGREGYLVLRRLLPPELVDACLRPAVRRAMELAGPTALERREQDRGTERSAAARAFTQRVNLWRLDTAVHDLVLSRRLGSVAAQLLAVSRVRLYHDQALVKEPGGGPTPWHQDQVYWPLDGAGALTIWIALVPVSSEMGPLRFARGSHLLGDRGGGRISEESEQRIGRLVEESALSIGGPRVLAPGDATVHASWTLHRAEANHRNEPREAFTVIYFADGARVTAPTPAQRADLEAFLLGLEPGDTANGELTPLVPGPHTDLPAR
jgi:ectoine hydroxylase-related dioxygenase (phytanoyl-CoA dioxygenase family)